MRNLKDIVDKRIGTLELTKEFVANKLDMSRTGFWQALENSSLKQEKLDALFKLLNIEPNFIFEWDTKIDLYQLNEPIVEYKSIKKIQSEVSENSEVIFLRSQVEKLMKIVEVLSSKIDTNSIN